MAAGAPFGRRAALTLPGLAATAQATSPAAAQPPLPLPLVRAPALPCADAPGELAALSLEGPCEAGILVLGQAFRAGELPRGAALAARLASGAPLAAQLDALAFHPDGSVRHGLVSLAAPALAAGARVGVRLARAPGGAPERPLDLAGALAGREVVVELAPLAGGTPWRVELLAAWRAAGGPAWQSGPLAVQGRVTRRVPGAAAGGVDSLRLVADLSAHADGTLWADVWLRNDIAMQANGGAAAYRFRLLMDGREARAAEVAHHPHYTGWGRRHGAARGTAAPPALAFARWDAAALAAAGAVLPYDLSTGVPERQLAEWARLADAPGWEAPFGPRGLRQRMTDGGARGDLGVTTLWQAAWLVSGDRRAARLALGQAEAAGNIPWHFWDMVGGADRRGGWLDLRRWPGIWADARGGLPPRGLAQPPPGPAETGWTPATSHQPALSFVPYLLTGRRAFLDNLTAQAAWNLTALWPVVRQMQREGWQAGAAPPSAAPAEDVLVVFQEPRGGAWAMRTLGDALWVAPEGDPNRAYLADVERRNWAWLIGVLPQWTAFQGEAHGWYPRWRQSEHSQITPFQTEYWAAVAALQALRGRDEARRLLAWMSNFIVGRFFQEARGFRPEDAIAYTIATATPGSGAGREAYRSWARIGQAMGVEEPSNHPGWRAADGEYGRLALLSLALTHRVLGEPRALAAHQWLLASGAPRIDLASVAAAAQQNVSPAGHPRVPAAAPRCAPGPG